MKDEQTYTTLDAYQAGYLVIRGFTPSLIMQGQRVVFSFGRTEALINVLSEYNAGATVEAVRFALTVKTLKSQIFSMKEVRNEA